VFGFLHGVIMHLSLVVLLLFGASQSQPPSPAPRKTSQPNSSNPAPLKRDSQKIHAESPLVVKTLPPVKTEAESKQETKDRNEKTTNESRVVILTGILAFIGFLQTIVFGYQAYKLRQTVESAGEQAEAMERHIGEAARSATAMENIVSVIKTGNQDVMRAYLTVVIGTPIYQMRRVGQSDLQFEGRPHLVNTGNTPARKVRILIKADILPNPIPEDFTFPLPDDPMQTAGSTVGAHQTLIMGGIVGHFVPDAEVADIKEGIGKILCVWGVVTYNDIFGGSHTTKFGQLLTWLPDNSIFGYYLTGQNDSD
jgi:hypothetical protein